MTFKWEMHFTVLLGNRKITQGPRETPHMLQDWHRPPYGFITPVSCVPLNQPTRSHPSLAVQGSFLENLSPGKRGNLLANTSNVCVCWDRSLKREMLSFAHAVPGILHHQTEHFTFATCCFFLHRKGIYWAGQNKAKAIFLVSLFFVILTRCSLEVISRNENRTAHSWDALSAEALTAPTRAAVPGRCPRPLRSPAAHCWGWELSKHSWYHLLQILQSLLSLQQLSAFQKLVPWRGKDSLCFMFNLQFCFPETLQINGFDYILRSPSVTQQTISSRCYPL